MVIEEKKNNWRLLLSMQEVVRDCARLCEIVWSHATARFFGCFLNTKHYHLSNSKGRAKKKACKIHLYCVYKFIFSLLECPFRCW